MVFLTTTSQELCKPIRHRLEASNTNCYRRVTSRAEALTNDTGTPEDSKGLKPICSSRNCGHRWGHVGLAWLWIRRGYAHPRRDVGSERIVSETPAQRAFRDHASVFAEVKIPKLQARNLRPCCIFMRCKLLLRRPVRVREQVSRHLRSDPLLDVARSKP